MLSFREFLTERVIQQALASSNLQSLRYDTNTEKLVIYFRSGGVYEYSDVPAVVVDTLRLDAVSKGQFFFDRIRDSYPMKILRKSRPGYSHAFNTAKSTAMHHFGADAHVKFSKRT